MGCDVDPGKVSAGQPNDDKGIEQVEANVTERSSPADVRRFSYLINTYQVFGTHTPIRGVWRSASLVMWKQASTQPSLNSNTTPYPPFDRSGSTFALTILCNKRRCAERTMGKDDFEAGWV